MRYLICMRAVFFSEDLVTTFMVRNSEFVKRWGRPNIITRRHVRILHENHKSNILNNFYLTAAIRSIEFSIGEKMEMKCTECCVLFYDGVVKNSSEKEKKLDAGSSAVDRQRFLKMLFFLWHSNPSRWLYVDDGDHRCELFYFIFTLQIIYPWDFLL